MCTYTSAPTVVDVGLVRSSLAISHTPPRYFQKVPTFEVAEVDSED